MRPLKVPSHLVGLGFLIFVTLSGVGADSPNDPPALTNWQLALTSFQKVGILIGQSKYAQAQSQLESCATTLPIPYAALARQYATQLQSAVNLNLSAKKADRAQLAALIELCSDLCAYDASLQLVSRLRKASSGEDEAPGPSLAWLLLESGKIKAALKEYQRKLAEEQVEVWKDYYKKQIELLQKRPANLTNVEFALEFVREHYLKGYDANADWFSALKELKRALAFASNGKEIVRVRQNIIKGLAALEDQAGVEAWEHKILAEFKSDREACAGVYVDRGVRAFKRKDFNEALSLFRKVAEDYPDTTLYGDAQYDVGLVLHEQQNYDHAISEYAKIFSSPVDDYAIDPDSSQDLKNYRYKAALRISECYEAQKDYTRALEYAEIARDRYRYLSWCKSCVQNVHSIMDERIKMLHRLVASNVPKGQKAQ